MRGAETKSMMIDGLVRSRRTPLFFTPYERIMLKGRIEIVALFFIVLRVA
jgi:hypothetical protein